MLSISRKQLGPSSKGCGSITPRLWKFSLADGINPQVSRTVRLEHDLAVLSEA
jgi:hypothetical protein